MAERTPIARLPLADRVAAFDAAFAEAREPATVQDFARREQELVRREAMEQMIALIALNRGAVMREMGEAAGVDGMAQYERVMKCHEETIAADRKAKALLVMCLNNAQRQDFEKHERFAIEVKHHMKEFPAGQFQISKAASFNVMHVETQERFCVTAVDCPIYDQMLTQKLLLEQDPETFFKTANREFLNARFRRPLPLFTTRVEGM